MKTQKFFVIGLLILIALVSCKRPKKEVLSFTKGDNKVLYHVYYRSGDTVHPKLNDLVTIKMRYYLPDTVLFNSDKLNEPLMFPMIKPLFQGDIYDGLKLMSPGDSMTFKVVADSFFMKTAMMKKLPSYVHSGTPMYFDVKLKKVQTQQAYLQTLKNKEQVALKNYLKKNKITIQPDTSGLYFIPLKKGKGRRPKKGDVCTVTMKVQTIGGTILWDRTNEPIDIEFGKDFDTKGLMLGLAKMHLGEKVRLIVPSKIGIGSIGRLPAVKPYTTIVYEISLNKFKTLAELKKDRQEKQLKKEQEKQRQQAIEKAKINNYLRSHNYKVKAGPTGIYHIIEKAGNGPLPSDTSHVQVRYKLSDINGKVLQDNFNDKKPFSFQLGTHSVIKGWEIGIKLMHKGEKAVLIVPSSLAYGDSGSGNQIKPYTTLIFEVKLLNK